MWDFGHFLISLDQTMLTVVSVSQAEVEETLKRIQSQKGVQGIIIVNSEGKTTKIHLHYIFFTFLSSLVFVEMHL